VLLLGERCEGFLQQRTSASRVPPAKERRRPLVPHTQRRATELFRRDAVEGVCFGTARLARTRVDAQQRKVHRLRVCRGLRARKDAAERRLVAEECLEVEVRRPDVELLLLLAEADGREGALRSGPGPGELAQLQAERGVKRVRGSGVTSLSRLPWPRSIDM
jgi:hypothetical protein